MHCSPCLLLFRSACAGPSGPTSVCCVAWMAANKEVERKRVVMSKRERERVRVKEKETGEEEEEEEVRRESEAQPASGSQKSSRDVLGSSRDTAALHSCTPTLRSQGSWDTRRRLQSLAPCSLPFTFTLTLSHLLVHSNKYQTLIIVDSRVPSRTLAL